MGSIPGYELLPILAFYGGKFGPSNIIKALLNSPLQSSTSRCTKNTIVVLKPLDDSDAPLHLPPSNN